VALRHSSQPAAKFIKSRNSISLIAISSEPSSIEPLQTEIGADCGAAARILDRSDQGSAVWNPTIRSLNWPFQSASGRMNQEKKVRTL
jgi:hypothetical protein